MTGRSVSAPAQRVLACAGVFIFGVLLAGCENGPRLGGDNRALEISGKTVQLPPGVSLHDVAVQATGTADFNPARLTIKSGDVVRFTTRDTRTHALTLTGPSEQANAALSAMTQRRSPPLVAAGQAWVISFKSLPPGNYTVSCLSHAGTATISVQ